MGILEEVNASYEKLSPVQKRIADFIFKYPDQVCFYSLKELSETLGVTEVTILRFTKKIGAQSFVEMKNRLREHLQTRLVHGDGLNRIADHVGGIRFGDHDKEEMFQEFVANEKNVIAKTFEQVSLKDILSAVAIIRQSRKIYVVGSELVTGLCAYTTRRLLTLGLEALDLSNSVMGYMSVANALIYFAAMDNPEETNKRRGRLSEVRSAIGSIDFVKDSL